jgi:hypothetical protein
MPVYFVSNNNAFQLAFLAWGYDTITSQPGAALEYLAMHLDQLRRIPEYSAHNWKAQNKCRYRCKSDYIYQVTSDIDDHIGHHQYAASLLWIMSGCCNICHHPTNPVIISQLR